MAQHSIQSQGAGHTPTGPAHFEQHHPTWKTYVIIGAILTIITAVEVSAYYTPAWESSRIYVPSMIFLSSIKFILVVLFYMHLKYDHKVFRVLFTGPFAVAFVTIVGLLFLFGQLVIRFGTGA